MTVEITPEDRHRSRQLMRAWVNKGEGDLLDEIAQVFAELRDTVEEYESALSYVPDYFREKWGYDEHLAAVKRFLADAEEAVE